MIARVTTWFGGMTRRERTLVGSAGIITALVVLVYGIILPVGSAFDAAARRHAESAARSARLMAQVKLLESPAPAAARLAGPIDQAVAASAQEAGFVLQSNQSRGNDATAIIVPTARPTAALGWLDALTGKGIAIDNLTITPAADGSVSINATLRRAGA